MRFCLVSAGTLQIYNSISNSEGANFNVMSPQEMYNVQGDLAAEAASPTQDFGFHSASPDPEGGLAAQASPYGSLESVGTASPDASSAFGAPGDYGSYGSVDANGVGTIGADSAGAFSSFGMNSFGDSGAATSEASGAGVDGGSQASTGESGSSQGSEGGSSEGGSSGGSEGGGGGGGD